MAKHFSESEKQRIKNRILDDGKELFEKYGVKKTSIDKLVEKVGIAKGTFYHFYTSREAMIYELILKVEMELHKEEMKNLNDLLEIYEFPEALKHVVWKSLEKMEEDPLLKTLNDPQFINEIWNKLSEQEKNQGNDQDQIKVKEFIEAAELRGYEVTVPPQVFNSLLMSIFILYINQHMIGEPWEETIELMITSLFEKLFIKIKGEKPALK